MNPSDPNIPPVLQAAIARRSQTGTGMGGGYGGGGMNFGSGSALLGGANQTVNPMQSAANANQVNPTQAVSPVSAGFNPNMVPPSTPNPSKSPASTINQSSNNGALMGMSMENDQIIKALSNKLRNNSAIEKMQGGA